MKFRLPLNLQLFADDMGAVDTGVETASDAGMQSQESEVTSSQSGVETQAVAEPEKQSNFEKAFAKRLADAQAKWEAEAAEKYKDYDTLKEVSDYFVEANKERGINDIMTLKEQIEMEKLQQRAEKENLPPEVLQRLDALEAKAAKVDQFEQQQQQAQQYQEFRTNLETFAKEKGANADELHAFMYENKIGSMEIAYKAMRADQLEQQLANAEKEGVKKFLSAKGSIPNVTGNTSQGHITSPAPKTFADARARAMQRFQT